MSTHTTSVPSRPTTLADRIDETPALDHAADPLLRATATALPAGPLRKALQGDWLGHPLHPMLTDLPIGFWTSSWVLDIVGGRRGRKASQTLLGLGVLSAVPTIAAGLADWPKLDAHKRRTGVVHAAANLTATAIYGASYVHRRRGHWLFGVTLGMAGAAVATAGGYLGGHLAFASPVEQVHVSQVGEHSGQMDLG